jgi:hypothetical protein
VNLDQAGAALKGGGEEAVEKVLRRRHCERSEAIPPQRRWIASSLRSSQRR